MPAPLRYDLSMEVPEKDEAVTFQALSDTMLKIQQTTYRDGGHALRGVHAKSHGILQGELEVLDGLDPTLAQGLFANGGRYPMVMRFSTVPGDMLDDSVSTPRGLAIKAFGVQGARLPDAGGTTQDFVLVNGPAFAAPNAKAFLGNLKLLAATTDKAQGAKKAISAVLRGAEHIIEAFGGKSSTLLALGGQPETHILGDSFYSQVPLLYGAYMVKVAVTPASPELKALTNQPVKLNGRPNGLREAVIDFCARHGAVWDIRVQLCTDLDTMPIENAQKVWPEDKSPYLPVGRIVVSSQTGWSEARSAAVDDGFSFSPWHGLAAHRPLGSVMRARKRAYELSAQFRMERTGKTRAEPATFTPLPD
jgi:hypothetical protein